MAKKKPLPKKPAKPGPKPELFKLEGDWEENVAMFFEEKAARRLAEDISRRGQPRFWPGNADCVKDIFR